MTVNATVTVLFTDLVDATELLERLGEVGARELRREHFDLLREAITAAGGHEVKSIGDGLMVVFQSAVDAVAASVAMQQGIDRHNRRDPLGRFEVRVGLNVGEPTREGDDYFGLPVVLAKRLCDAAEPGQILVSDVVRALVGPRVQHRFRALPPLDLKGVGLTPAYEVMWEPIRPVSVPLPAALTPPIDAVFVGRERELERLHAAWKEALAGTRRAVLVGGEPGVGKTRLAAEFAESVAGEGVVLYGRCDEDLGVPYQPFAEAVRASLAVASDAELAERIGRTAASMIRFVPELRDRLPDVVVPPAADAEAERYLLFEAVAEYFAAISSDQPLLLVLDDLHWATKPTLVLLRHLLRSTVPMNVLVIGTFRDTELDRAQLLGEALADLRRDADVERMSLVGLDRASVVAYVTASGYGDGEAAELADAVHAGTEGNPFFVGEVLRHLKESGQSLYEGIGPPPGVADVVLSRLSHLSSTTNRVLSIASVIGPRFELPVLERLIDATPDALLDALDEGVRARVVVELPAVGNYTFAHALIRQVLLGELSASRRARMHWSIVEALASLPDADDRVQELAFHSAAAAGVGDVRRAAAYSLAASRRSLDRLSYESAVELANQGLSVLADAGADDQRAELLLTLAEGCSFTGDMRAMKEASAAAANAAQRAGWAEGMARAAVLYGRWIELGLTDDTAERMCEAALAALPEDDHRWRARVTATLANYRVNGLSLGADVIDLADESLALARTAGDDESILWALYLRAITLVSTGQVEERLALAEELVRRSAERDDPRGKLDALVTRASARLETGDVAGFEADTTALEELGAQLHWWAAHFWAGNFRITNAVLRGNFAEADVASDEQFKLGAQDVNAFNAYASQLFAVRRQLGRLDEIEPLIADAVADNPKLVAFRAALAAAAIDDGRRDEGRRLVLALAEGDFEGVPRDVGFTSALALLAESVASLGLAEQAGPLARLLEPHAGRLLVGGVGIVCFGAADRFLGMLAATMGRPDDAARLYEAAARLEAGIDARPELARTRYWWGRLHAEGDLADPARSRELLGQAGDVARELKMAALVARVEEALGSGR